MKEFLIRLYLPHDRTPDYQGLILQRIGRVNTKRRTNHILKTLNNLSL